MNKKINIKKIMNNVGKNSLQASQQLRMVQTTKKNKALQLASKKIKCRWMSSRSDRYEYCFGKKNFKKTYYWNYLS